ncbi:hypothetical protein NIES4102_42110 (plasmid) [Chondrocystis sp. NIES-4102]|nr:hypothetical protein NIES4102_42110 [Chondrocystis sp. NIES-4102]
MSKILRKILSIIPIAIVSLSTNYSVAKSQIVPDQTLGMESSQINSVDELRNHIEGGVIRGNNLFHSFQEFNVEQGTSVNFSNPENIVNIFSRVTGKDISDISGTLGVDGAANLFFINPNGIIFGENASVDINGSFLATTAESIEFNNGESFSAITPEQPSISINFPVGLNISTNSSRITIRGNGHSLFLADTSDLASAVTSPIIGSQQNLGGITGSGRTLAFISSGINLTGATISNFSGKIELGSIKLGEIKINLSSDRIDFDYLQALDFENIVLNERSLIDVSGDPAGIINVIGKDIILSENSLVFSSNSGQEPAGNINISASRDLLLNGITKSDSFLNFSIIKPGVISQSLSSGKGSDININARNLSLKNFGLISSSNYGSASGGNINISVEDSLTVIGIPVINTNAFAISSISSVTLSSGFGGDISIRGGNFSLEDGGLLISQSLSFGSGGNININFDNVEIVGSFPLAASIETYLKSTIATTTIFSKGGEININSSTLNLKDGGRISSTTSGIGEAGNTLINVNESIEIKGIAIGSLQKNERNVSQIVASSEITDPSLIELFGLPPIPEGRSGNLSIYAKNIFLSDGGKISVENQGIGDAGNLEINIDSLFLDRGGKISASTISGEGGNININAEDIQLLNESEITSSADGDGDGGNITINSDVILGVKNSDITANAVDGRGGNINVDTIYLLGLQERSQPTPFNDITASSQFGITGNIEIRSPENLTEEVAFNRPLDFNNQQNLIEQICAGRKGKFGKITNVGSSANQISPDDFFDSPATTNENESLPNSAPAIPVKLEDDGFQDFITPDNQILEANVLKVNPNNTISLLSEPRLSSPVSCPTAKF